jgi:hypothetical protein
VNEVDNVETWSRLNNLKLNRKKTREIALYDRKRRQRCRLQPPEIPEIARVSLLKVLGVTITNGLSMSEHVQQTLASCAQALYALKILRAHGLPDAALHQICRSVIHKTNECSQCVVGFRFAVRFATNKLISEAWREMRLMSCRRIMLCRNV